MTTSPPVDLLALLTQDHMDVEQRFAQFDTASLDEREDLFWLLADQLIRHEMAEEAVMYPALEQVPGGKEVAEQRLGEQDEAERQLSRMEALSPTSDEFSAELLAFRAAVLKHAQLEETEAFPLLSHNLPEAELESLGERYAAEKRSELNHPRPAHASTGPPVHTTGPVSLFGRIKDAVTGH